MDWLQYFIPVVVALITGGLSYLGVAKTVKAEHDKTITEIKAGQDKLSINTQNQIDAIQKDIKRLEDKQDKHNSVIERTFKLEQLVVDLEKRINRTEVM